MDTDVFYTLHIETYSHDKEFIRNLGVRRIDKWDYDQMEIVKNKFVDEFTKELRNANKNNLGLIKLDSSSVSIKDIKKYYATYEPNDL